MKVQKEIEVILTRQLASYLAMPIFVVDPQGSLIYYNESAEEILGCRFEETGEMPADEWGTIFIPTDANGLPLAPEQLPLLIALHEHRPIHRDFWIQSLNSLAPRRHIEATAFPLIGQAERDLGAVAIFWEVLAL
ncbi:MAG TPA: PAS domain-containing protein [Chloroflexia bacterium]|nr:PAS domain-containing protein [Chloroflexia bacterium]